MGLGDRGKGGGWLDYSIMTYVWKCYSECIILNINLRVVCENFKEGGIY